MKYNRIQGIQIWRAVGLLLLFIVGLSAGGYAQDGNSQLADFYKDKVSTEDISKTTAEKLKTIVTFKKGSHKLVQALQSVTSQTGLKLSYSEQVIPHKKMVEIKKAKMTAKQGLWDILEGTGYRFGISASGQLVLVKMQQPLSESQQETITGTVTDGQSGETLPGVNILVKGTSTGTSTDSEGNFELTVESLQDTLVFSFIGYQTQQVPVNGQMELNVDLQPQTFQGDEMVVVGYSTKRLSELSSSVTVVNEEKLQEGVISEDLGTMLQGKVSGLAVSNTQGRPGAEPNTVIRGVGSLGAGSSPLYVVDGVIMRDGSNVNPSDVASVTVLKDAAATGLYGSRASNGVIVITTKRGESGKTQVNYSGSYGVTESRNFETMNSAELYAQYKLGYENFYNDKVEAGDPNFENLSLEQYLADELPPSLLDRGTGWNDRLTRSGYVNRHQLSVSGGNEKTTFYLSGNYTNEQGTLLGTEYKELDFRTNLEHEISERFIVQARVNAGYDKSPNDPVGGQGSTINQYYNNIPWDPAYEDDGTTPYNPLEQGNQWLGNASSNYFYNRVHQKSVTKNYNINGDLQLDVLINDWMTFSTTNRYSLSEQDFSELLDKFHQNASAEGGLVTQDYNYSNSFLTSNKLNISQDFRDHHFAGILGQEFNYIKHSQTIATGMGIPVGLSAIDAASSPNSVGGGLKSETGFSSFFGQLDYNYLNRYYLVGSVRTDASSRFGANNRWANFSSLGGSWLLSSEDFLGNVAWLDLLKLKASYGVTGNANIQPYLSLGTYIFSSNASYNGLSGTRPARIPNPDLTWEKAYTTNIGLEFELLSRISVNLDFYNRENKDLLQSVPLSAASGYASQQRNVGSIRNRGIDLSINTVNINNGDLRWETAFNVNINRNEVLKLNNGEDINSGNFRISEGLSRRHFYMREWAGVDPQTGDPLWFRWEDENGNRIDGGDHMEPSNTLLTNDYNQASNLFISSGYPDFTGGIQNKINYRNFSFRVVANFVSGQKIFFAHRMRIDSDGAHMAHNEIKRDDDWVRWKEPGDEATHPRMIAGGNKNSNQPSSRYIEDGSYLRIQNINLAYTFAKGLFGLSNLQINAGVDNLALFTDFTGGDPDVNIESSVVNQGANARYSPTRKFLIGLNIDF